MADYTMRAWQNVLLTYTYWVSPGGPDFLGVLSGYPLSQIDDALVVLVVETGGGTTPGQGGGEFEYPPMTMEPYNPSAIDIDATDHPQPPKQGHLVENFMTNGDGPAGQTLATMPTDWATGDQTDLMAEHP